MVAANGVATCNCSAERPSRTTSGTVPVAGTVKSVLLSTSPEVTFPLVSKVSPSKAAL